MRALLVHNPSAGSGQPGREVLLGLLREALLDVVYLTADRRQAMIDWLRSGAVNHPPLEVRKARKVTLTWEHGPLRVDDEVYPAPDVARDIIVEIEPHGLHVCVPGAEG
jgi:hypothetical protein